jgi:predicted outer membrane repeat protein
VEESTFSGNYAGVNGGVLYGAGFSSIKFSKKTKLTNNLALSSGDDFFLANTDEAFEMDEVEIQNPYAKNSIHAEYIQVILNRVKITNINKNPKSEQGSAL